MTPKELESFFYNVVIHQVTRRSWSFEIDWDKGEPEQVKAVHDGFVVEYPILETASPSWYGPRLAHGAFVEALRQANSMHEKHAKESQKILGQMNPTDWKAYYKLVELEKN